VNYIDRVVEVQKMSNKRRQEDEDKKHVKKPANHWSLGLLSSMNDPELLIKEDDKVVVIKDKYPKVNVGVIRGSKF
jgi:hypothetical protein